MTKNKMGSGNKEDETMQRITKRGNTGDSKMYEHKK